MLTIAPLPRYEKTLFEQRAFDEHNDASPPEPVLHFMGLLKQSSDLFTTETSVSELFLMQLEWLLVESIIAPLSIIADCRMGQLLHSHNFDRSLRLLLAELCVVIKALPELASYPNRPHDSRRSESRVL